MLYHDHGGIFILCVSLHYDEVMPILVNPVYEFSLGLLLPSMGHFLSTPRRDIPSGGYLVIHGQGTVSH